MKKHLTPLLLISLGAMLAGACASPDVGRRGDAILEGHFGELDDFSGAPELNSAYVWGEQTTLDVRTRGSNWVIMAALTLNGRLGEGDLAPGSVLHVTGPDTWDDYESFPAVSMLGCSGPADDEWYTDCTPDDIVVQIDEGSQDGTLLVSFDATFPGYCGDGGGPPGTDPGEPPPPGVYPGEPPPGSDPGEPPPGSDPGEPPPGSDPGEPPSGEPVEPLPAAAPTDGSDQVISGVIEIALADILEDGGDWYGEPEPFVGEEEGGF